MSIWQWCSPDKRFKWWFLEPDVKIVFTLDTKHIVCIYCYNLNKLSSKQPKCENFTNADNGILCSSVAIMYIVQYIQHIIVCIPLWFIQQLIWRAFAIHFGTFDAICSFYFYDILVMYCIHVYLYEHIRFKYVCAKFSKIQWKYQ